MSRRTSTTSRSRTAANPVTLRDDELTGYTPKEIVDDLFENDRVRVLKKIIRNGETPPLHSHPDSVVVYLNPCAWMEDDDEGGKRMQSFKFGEPTWAPAGTYGGETSNVVQECHVVVVELLE